MDLLKAILFYYYQLLLHLIINVQEYIIDLFLRLFYMYIFNGWLTLLLVANISAVIWGTLTNWTINRSTISSIPQKDDKSPMASICLTSH